MRSEFDVNLTSQLPSFAAIFASELSGVELLQIISCQFVTSYRIRMKYEPGFRHQVFEKKKYSLMDEFESVKNQ